MGALTPTWNTIQSLFYLVPMFKTHAASVGRALLFSCERDNTEGSHFPAPSCKGNGSPRQGHWHPAVSLYNSELNTVN